MPHFLRLKVTCTDLCSDHEFLYLSPTDYRLRIIHESIASPTKSNIKKRTNTLVLVSISDSSSIQRHINMTLFPSFLSTLLSRHCRQLLNEIANRSLRGFCANFPPILNQALLNFAVQFIHRAASYHLFINQCKWTAFACLAFS
ncbi:hypothetical protein GFC28_972 [Anoxybacillus sp. B2M1]|jgi:hypothetical protein|nr:hypothetical protein GFC28_972 [Anoxybacillus sp. B2M1]